jgi:uncharacterized membrane protein
MHSHCVNDGQCREVQQAERSEIAKLCSLQWPQLAETYSTCTHSAFFFTLVFCILLRVQIRSMEMKSSQQFLIVLLISLVSTCFGHSTIFRRKYTIRKLLA